MPEQTCLRGTVAEKQRCVTEEPRESEYQMTRSRNRYMMGSAVCSGRRTVLVQLVVDDGKHGRRVVLDLHGTTAAAVYNGKCQN